MKTGISASSAIEKTVVANGAITAGDRLLLEEISGVLKAKKFALEENVYTPASTSSADPYYYYADFDVNDSGKIVVVYSDSLNSSYATYIVGTINSDGTITFGTKGVIVSQSRTPLSIKYVKSRDKWVVKGNRYIYTGTLSGNTITFLESNATDGYFLGFAYDEEQDAFYDLTKQNAGSYYMNIAVILWNTDRYYERRSLLIDQASNTYGYLNIYKNKVYFLLYQSASAFPYKDTLVGIYGVNTQIFGGQEYITLSKDSENIDNFKIQIIQATNSRSEVYNFYKDTIHYYKNKVITLSIGRTTYYPFLSIKNNIFKIQAIAEETVLDTANVKIKYITPYQLYNYFTSLIRGEKYYIKSSNGDLTLIENQLPFGSATSDTEILATSQNYLFN